MKTFVRYIRKLSPKSDVLFQRPKKTIPTDAKEPWYDAAPLGVNTLGNMMPNLSEKAGLNVRYTNHSLRATTVHLLDRENIPSMRIFIVYFQSYIMCAKYHD